MVDGVKTCTKCGNEYPATAEHFHRRQASSDGFASRCKSCCREYRCKHPQNLHDYYVSHKEECIERCRRWRLAQPDFNQRYLEYRQNWLAVNADRVRETTRRYRHEHCQTPEHRLNRAVSRGISKSLEDGKNGKHWEDLVGYTLADLVAHLEPQFTKGMTWDNYGEWHIDHIKPVSHFCYENYDDPGFEICWSLWNLQPMWAFENASKGNRCEAPPLPLI